MHFRFLIEDQSGTHAMRIIAPKLLGDDNTYDLLPYKGIGRIPKGLRPNSDADKRILLDQLPRLLRGFGKNPHSGVIIIICDLDDRDKTQFEQELENVLNSCAPKPNAFFCLAVEEFEAWYLGDLNAVVKAYPNAKNSVLNKYKNDEICGTWELLADAVCKGGSKALSAKGWQAVGEQKSIWAKEISPHMAINENKSPSFQNMVEVLEGVLRR